MFFLFLILVPGLVLAQGNTDPYQNRVIMKYYSHEELQTIESTMPGKFQQIKNYFIYSFTVTPIPCSSCAEADLSLIDIREYEAHRHEIRPITITDEVHGFKITLMSKAELGRLNEAPVNASQTGIRSALNFHVKKEISFPKRN